MLQPPLVHMHSWLHAEKRIQIALIDTLQFQKSAQYGASEPEIWYVLLHRCQERRQVWSCSSASLQARCTQRSEPACWAAAWRWRTPALTRWSSPGRRKTVIWKHVLILPSFSTVTHIPPLTAHPAQNKRKVGQGGKTSFPHVIDPLPYLIRQRFSFCFHDLPCSIPLCVMQESLESIPDKVITAPHTHTFGELISYPEGREQYGR